MSNMIAPYMIVKRYTFDDTQSEYRFEHIEDALNFWHDSVVDQETYGGVALGFYKDGMLYQYS